MSRATQGEQDNYEMHVRAANIVSARVENTPVEVTDGQRKTREQWGGAEEVAPGGYWGGWVQ